MRRREWWEGNKKAPCRDDGTATMIMPPSHALHRLQRASASLREASPPTPFWPPRLLSSPPSTAGVCTTVDVAGRVLGACAACLDTGHPMCFRNERATGRTTRRKPGSVLMEIAIAVLSGEW